MRRFKKPHEYPIRTCRYFDSCKVCGKRINTDEKYYDGGYGRRYHIICATPTDTTPELLNHEGEV